MNNKEHYENLLTEGDMKKAFSDVIKYSKLVDENCYDDFIILYSRWNRNRNKKLRGILNFSQDNIEENQILVSFYEYLKNLFD